MNFSLLPEIATNIKKKVYTNYKVGQITKKNKPGSTVSIHRHIKQTCMHDT